VVGLAALLIVLAGVERLTAAATVSTFTLEAVRGRQVWGPFEMRDGTRINLAAGAYELRIYPPDRLSFISLRSGRVFGPVQGIDGRLLEIDGAMYAFAHGVGAGSRRPPLPPVPQPPPTPPPIPIPEAPAPTLAHPRPVLPAPLEELRVALWIDLLDRTPMKWEVGGERGSDTEIERTSLGGGLAWRGWSLQIGLSGDVSSGDILPGGLEVSESRLDSGSGWSLAGGYRQPFLRDGGWEAYGGLRAVIRRDDADLRSTSATGQGGTNATVELTFASHVTGLTLTEVALWLDAGLAYTATSWGLSLDLSVQPVGNIAVDGDLARGGTDLPVEAKRSQPLYLALGGWLGYEEWRCFGEVAAGAEQRFRLGVSRGFR
jgi:hypothetical protein